MSELLTVFGLGLDAFTDRVAQVTDWNAPTPCSEWTTGDLVAHLIDEHRWAPALLAGHDLATARDIVAGTEDRGDRERNWLAAVVESRRAFGQPGTLERTVELSRGVTPVSEYLSEMITDLAVHSWDLGVAVHDRTPLPAMLVDVAYGVTRDMGDLTSSGMFAAPVVVSDDAPLQDKLIGLSGRDPR